MMPPLRRALILLLTGLAVWLLLRTMAASGFDPARFAGAFRSLDVRWLLSAIALGLLTYAGRAVRWATLMRPLFDHTPDDHAPVGHARDGRPTPIDLLGLTKFQLIGFAATLVAGRAGEMVRPYLIARWANVSFGSQVALWVVERLLDLLSVLVIFSLALGVYQPPQNLHLHPAVAAILQTGGRSAAALSILLLVLLPLAASAPSWSHHIADRLPGVLAAPIRSLVSGFAVIRSRRTLGLSVAYSLAEWLLIAACYHCVFRSFPPAGRLSATDTLIVLGFVSFGSVIQLPAVGGGMQLVAILVLTELYGLGNEDATAAALLLWLVGFALGVPLGLFLAVREGWNWSNFKNLARDAAASRSTPA
jgi:uncharacterized membrane protein YbhN (UPF0104 family)